MDSLVLAKFTSISVAGHQERQMTLALYRSILSLISIFSKYLTELWLLANILVTLLLL